MTLKILFVTGEFPPMQGGVGDYTRELGLALRDLGCQVQVLTGQQGGPAPGLTVFSTVKRWNWSCWPTILDLVCCHRPDVVHIQYQAAAFGMHPAINLLPRRLRRLGFERPRILVTFHDLKVPYLFPKAGPLRQWVIHELACQCDAVVTTNRADYSDLRRRLDTPPALIPIGSNIKPVLPAYYQRDDWRARYGAQPGDLLIGFFGFVNDRKGLDTLLHALRLLGAGDDPTEASTLADTDCIEGARPPIGRPPANPQLLMIGGQTGASDPTNVAYLEHIQALIADLGLVNRVHWTGYLPPGEVSACFAATDMCVLPFRDGVSLLHGTLHAALAHGVPVLTTEPSEPIPELINGVHVLMVPREQPAALAEGIRSLAAAPQLRQALGRAAQTLSERFRWDKIAVETLQLYRSVTASEATMGSHPHDDEQAHLHLG